MASGTEISNALAKAMADQVTIKLDSGDVGGILCIFEGTIPANCEAADSGTLLAVLPLSDPAFAAAVDGNGIATAYANGITSDLNAAASGTAQFFRAYSCNTSQVYANRDVCYIQGTAGEAADSTDLTLNDKTIVTGGTVSVTSWQINVPES